jgi:hypothetical protein
MDIMDIYALTCRHMSKICPCRKENCSKIRKWPVANKFRKTQKCTLRTSCALEQKTRGGKEGGVSKWILLLSKSYTWQLLENPSRHGLRAVYLGTFIFFKLSDILWQFPRPQNHKGPAVETERSKTERGSDGPGLALSAGAHTVFLLVRGGVGYVAVAGKIFRQGN